MTTATAMTTITTTQPVDAIDPVEHKSDKCHHPPIQQFTLRDPPYTYFHLSVHALNSQPGPPSERTSTHSLDEITARTYLTSALQQYLGVTGTAIALDILKVDGASVFIRVPSDDEAAVAAALSQWVSSGARAFGLRIRARGSWLGGVLGRGRGGTGAFGTGAGD